MRPQKKEVKENEKIPTDGEIYLFNAVLSEYWQRGYNHACEEWEGWLPNEDEIRAIVTKNIEFVQKGFGHILTINHIELAKAIADRINKDVTTST